MPGVFSPTANIATKLVLYLLLAGLVTLVGGAWFFPSTTYATRQGIVQPQPAPRSSRTQATLSHPPAPGAGAHTREALEAWGVKDVDGLIERGAAVQITQ